MTAAGGTEGKLASGSSSESDAPKLAYWHVWTAEDGTTRQTRCSLSAFQKESMGGKAAPQWNDHLAAGPATVLIANLPVGWIGDWHGNPRPQWIIPLSGCWFVETTDGTRAEMGPGEISFGADQHAKPDAQGRQGHRSGTVGDVPAVLMIVQLEDPMWIGARPGAFG